MSGQGRYLKILSKIIPAGAVSASLLLGSATPSEASLTDAQPSASTTLRVSERLGAIRDAVSAIAPVIIGDPSEGATRLSWHNIGWPNWSGKPFPKPLPQKDPHPFPRH
jgi:hypothetical protein